MHVSICILCMCVYVHTCLYAHVYKCVLVCIVCMCALCELCMCVHSCEYACVHICTCVYTCLCVYMRVCAWQYVRMCVYLYACVCDVCVFSFFAIHEILLCASQEDAAVLKNSAMGNENILRVPQTSVGFRCFMEHRHFLVGNENIMPKLLLAQGLYQADFTCLHVWVRYFQIT